MTIAVLGATSMLGMALIKQCLTHDIHVYAFIHPGSSKRCKLPVSDLITVFECNLEDLTIFSSEGISVDTFYHIGWTDTDKSGRNSCKKQLKNVQYTLGAVKLAQRMQCKQFIGTGSQAEYGRINARISSDSPINPETSFEEGLRQGTALLVNSNTSTFCTILSYKKLAA